MVLQFKIGDEEFNDWVVMPELSPDRLTLECPEKEAVEVTFKTDQETRVIPVTLDQRSVRFNILVRDEVEALTELKCIPQIARYSGDFSADRETAENFEADITPVLKTYFKPDEPGIAILISEGDNTLYVNAIGISDYDTGAPRTIDEAFEIASVSKEFTTVAILQLVEQNALRLDDPLNKFFDDLPNGERITIDHLLSHTHGLPQIRLAPDYDATIPRTLENALAHIREQGAMFEPGDQYEYGNISYYLLGVIAEQASGMDRETYVRERLFAPAGMTDSYLIFNRPQGSQRVKGYNQLEDSITPRTFETHISHAFGAGDIVTTLNDLRRWQKAVSDGTLIAIETFEMASTLKTLNDGSQIERGYSFVRGEFNGMPYIYNTGDFSTHTRVFYMPSRDLSIVLNTNGTHQYDDVESSVVLLQVMGKVLNTQFLSFFGDEIDLNDP
ncbi:MAG: serine hydrolase domain-containing protein [Pseudomonadota bacterium]